jgi:hypothetical protein
VWLKRFSTSLFIQACQFFYLHRSLAIFINWNRCISTLLSRPLSSAPNHQLLPVRIYRQLALPRPCPHWKRPWIIISLLFVAMYSKHILTNAALYIARRRSASQPPVVLQSSTSGRSIDDKGNNEVRLWRSSLCCFSAAIVCSSGEN